MNRPIGVVGAGTMGTGVAQCFAQNGYEVVVVDPDATACAGSRQQLHQGLRLYQLSRQRTAGASVRPAADPPADVLARVEWTDSLYRLAGCRFIIECVPERVELKRRVFTDLEALCPRESIFATCTSAILITRIGSFTQRPDRVIGTHFMNPAPVKDTVEVIRAPSTSGQTLNAVIELLTTIGKKAVVVSDAPGFVTNRVLMLTINEAAAVVEEGTADAASVDQIFHECFGHPLGPLRTADLIGLDTVLDSLRVLTEQLGGERFAPCHLLTQLVAQGHLGRKSGQGFYRYPSAAAGAPSSAAQGKRW